MIGINQEKCSGCGRCVDICPEVLGLEFGKVVIKNLSDCVECGVCMDECPCAAIKWRKGRNMGMIKAEQYRDGCQIDDPDYPEWQALEDMVDAFAEKMKLKLKRKLSQRCHGWDDPGKKLFLKKELEKHARRKAGQYVDIANLAAMLWNMEQDEIK